MKTLSKSVLLALITVGLTMGGAAHAQTTNKTSGKVKPASVRPGTPATGSKKPDTLSEAGPGTQPERPERPDNSNKLEDSDGVRQMLEDFKQAQNRFLEEQKQLRQRLKEATEDDRARIRHELQLKRQTFLDAQADRREEIRRTAKDLKDTLKDHRDVLDAAKEDAKERATNRKGGGD